MYTFFILLLSFTLVSTNPVSIDTGRNPIDALSSQTDNANILLGDDSDDRIDVSDATMNSPELTDPSDGVPHSSEEASNLLLASYTPNEVPDIPAFSSNEAPSPLPVQSNSQLTEAIPVELQAGAGGCSSRGTKKKRQLSADARFCPSGVSSQYNQGGDQSQERSNDENASNSKPSPSNSYENNVVNIKRKRKKPSCGEKIPVCCQENPVQAVTVGDHTYFNYAICVSCEF